MSLLRQTLTALAALVVAVLLAALGSVPAGAVPAEPTPHGRTRAGEAARVDAVPTPELHWHPCRDGYACTSVALPLDYDDPTGPTVSVALLKVPAADPAHRIGSLFLNPGGPGGSGQDIAVRAAAFLSPAVLDRFDLVGMDPRGTNDSTRVECYSDAATQAADTDVLATGFPDGRTEEAAFRQAAGHLAHACSTVGRPLSAAMSTSEVARDLDVLRRAVGDRRLTYLGWSYGTYLGQVYADLFPDRFRALAIDGVVDPVAWQGTAATADLPMSLRLDSASGTSRALAGVLRRCRTAGVPRCPLAEPERAFADVADALRRDPLRVTDEDGATYDITYAGFVHDVLFTLYQPEAVEDVPLLVQLLQQMIDSRTTTATARTTASARAATRYARVVAQAARASDAASPLANDYELNAAVACSDSRNPVRSRRWVELGARADRQSRYFGRYWLWTSAVCAGEHWTARDEDADAGSFNRWTRSPVLVVGNYYDPATSYGSAVAVARRLPHSRLLSSRSWGHTAYGTSACATVAVDDYLLTGTLPAPGTVCVGDVQPFAR